MTPVQLLGYVLMGALTIVSLLMLGAAMRQPAAGAAQITGSASLEEASRRRWTPSVALLLYLAVGVEVIGMAIGLNGYRTHPLEPIHALYIVGAVGLSAVASILVYVSSEARVQRHLRRAQ